MWREFGDETVVMDWDRAHFHELNSTGSFVWRKLNEGGELKSISRDLAAEFGIDLSEAERDTRELLETLNNSGLVECPI